MNNLIVVATCNSKDHPEFIWLHKNSIVINAFDCTRSDIISASVSLSYFFIKSSFALTNDGLLVVSSKGSKTGFDGLFWFCG